MCSVKRALVGVGTMGMSETVRAGMQMAKGDLSGGLTNMLTMGAGGALTKAPGMPAMPELPDMSTVLPGVPPPPAATAGATASPFSLSMRPRKSQSLRTDRGTSVGTGLNIPT